MKKIIALALAVVLAATCLVMSGCVTAKAAVKVYTEYELTAEEYAFAIAKENTELMTAANELLAELKANGELDNIINSFFDGSAKFVYENPVATVPTGAERENYLVVATNAYFPPFEYYEGNKLTGVDMKIASLLAEKLGKTLYIYDMEFDSVVISVKNGDSDIEMMAEEYNRRRKYIYNGLKGIGIEVFEPQGAFYIFPNIGQFGMSSEQFCEKLLRDYKCAIVPGDAFGDCGSGFARISYAYSIKHITAALERIEAFITDIKKGKV